MTLQKPWRPLKLGSGASYEATFSNDGRLLAVIGRRVSLWDVFARRRLWSCRPAPHPSSAAFSPRDDIIAVKHTTGLIATLSAVDGKLIRTFGDAEALGTDVVFSPCGEYLIDATADSDVVVRRVRNGQVAYRQPTPPNTLMGSISRLGDGKQWLIHRRMKAHDSKSVPPPSQIEVWDWPFGDAPKSRWRTGIGLYAKAKPSLDGKTVAMAVWATSRLHVFDIAKRRQIAEAKCRRGAMSATFARGGKHILVRENDTVAIYEMKAPALKRLRSIALHMAADVASSPVHDLVALSSWDAGFVVDPSTAPRVLVPVPAHIARSRKLLET